MSSLSINQWAPEDRPREKLRDQGAQSLSKAELLAILIGSGSKDKSAVDLMQDILHDCGDNLNTLGKMSVRDLTAYAGIGEAKAVAILAACELGKRRQMEKAAERVSMDNPQLVYEHMRPRMQDLDVEEAWVLLMNQHLKLIRTQRLSHGGICETSVDVRLILKEALLSNATALVLCHNHPSGELRPSGPDNTLTQTVKEACRAVRIQFVDHVIITDGGYYSYRQEGKL